MASILQTKHYDLLAKYWKKRLQFAKTVGGLESVAIIHEYRQFTEYLHLKQDNFRISHFDKASEYERKF